MKHFFFLLSVFCYLQGNAQLKFLIEDFEGFADHAGDLKPNGLFTFGNTKISIDRKQTLKKGYSGERCLRVSQNSTPDYGGWGKGVSMFVELDPSEDYLNFYFFDSGGDDLKIELQEDDNGNGSYDKEADDSWEFILKPIRPNEWDLVSIPLSAMKDGNKGGDGKFNIGYKKGKFLCLLMTLAKPVKDYGKKYWLVDFICFSKGKLPQGAGLFDAPAENKLAGCSLGAWSKEGNSANFSEIAYGFESNFKSSCDKRLGVVHLFQPFAVDGGNTQNHYPSVERINKIIEDGYVPMVTLEDHFVNAHPGMKQPNLYSIVEGHFDVFFADWATQIRKVNGVVLLRILHEFNGDWYPWCIAKNDNDPKLLVKAYQHIRNIFKEQDVGNVRFIWCPNSISFPQESWNYIMDAYPGDAYVDYVALDIYNGAGKENSVWRSFRKEGIENYYTLTQQLPHKPLLVCEAASRERRGDESQTAQSKQEWIRDMSEALSTDMSQVKLLTWFNEKESFKVNSSPASQKAFLNYVMKNPYFQSGTKAITTLLKP
jgi:hypothetical protein